MNNNIENENRNKLVKVREYVSKKIVWENYDTGAEKSVVMKKSNYNNRTMKTYNSKDLIQELSIKYYNADIECDKLEKENEKLLEKIKILEDNIKNAES